MLGAPVGMERTQFLSHFVILAILALFGHAFQSEKCPIMFLGSLDETSCVRDDDLASISTAFLPDERRGLGGTQTG